MNEEFISYDQAAALKELGFNEACFGWYFISNTPSKENVYLYSAASKVINNNPEQTISAPLYQQAFRWFSNLPDWPIECWIECWIEHRIPIRSRQYQSFYWRRGEKKVVGIYASYQEAQNTLLNKIIELLKKQ